MYMLYGELGRYPISITIKARIIGFWARIITDYSSKYVSIIYQKMLQIGAHKFKWIKHVQSILQEVGRNDIWISHNERIPKNTQHIVKKIQIDLHKQN